MEADSDAEIRSRGLEAFPFDWVGNAGTVLSGKKRGIWKTHPGLFHRLRQSSSEGLKFPNSPDGYAAPATVPDVETEAKNNARVSTGN